MTYRDYMREHDENLSWCRPYVGKRVSVAVNEGRICSMTIDGQEIHPGALDPIRGYVYTPEQVERAARAANEAYDLYKGWDDLHILLEGEVSERPCHECPWFEQCDAMDGQYGEDD